MYNDVLQKYQEVLEQAIASEMVFFENVQLKQLPAGHEETIKFEMPDNTQDHFVTTAPWGLTKQCSSLYPLSNLKEYFKMMMEGAFNRVVLKTMDPETETSEYLNPHVVYYTDGLVEDMFRLQDQIHKSYPNIKADQVFVPELRPDEHKDSESPLYDLTWRVEKKALEKAGFRIMTAPISNIILFDRNTKPVTAWFCQDPVFTRKGVIHLNIGMVQPSMPTEQPRPMKKLQYEVACWMEFAIVLTKPKMTGQILMPPKKHLDKPVTTFNTTQGHLSVVNNGAYTIGSSPVPNFSSMTGFNVDDLVKALDTAHPPSGDEEE